MDVFVQEKLQQCRLFEKLEKVFTENEIDQQTFDNLTDQEITELIPALGMRKKFQNFYKNYKTVLQASEEEIVFEESLGSLDNSLTETDTDSSVSIVNEEIEHGTGQIYPFKATLGLPYEISDYQNELRHLLETSLEGQEVIKSYGKGKKFLRSKLCTLIIRNELKNDIDKTITTARFKELATQINDIFFHEDPHGYFIPYRKDSEGRVRTARGRLWSSYIYIRRKLRTLGLIEKKKKKAEEKPNTDLGVLDIDNENITWLKNNVAPFPEVIEKWTQTSEARLKAFSHLSIGDYMKIFPALQQPLGYTLLEIDFNHLHQNKAKIFLLKWTEIAPKLFKYLSEKDDKIIQSYVSEYRDLKNDDSLDDIFALTVLPLLLGTVNLKCEKPGQHWKPSKVEIKDGFIMHVKDISDLESALYLREQKYASFNFTAQPLPVIVGKDLQNIEACYVVVNNYKYKVETVFKAVDLCFKVYHALNAKYPVECDIVWTFIQTFIYEIKTPQDNRCVSISTVISDLNRI